LNLRRSAARNDRPQSPQRYVRIFEPSTPSSKDRGSITVFREPHFGQSFSTGSATAL
jgi:hypothetical protein